MQAILASCLSLLPASGAAAERPAAHVAVFNFQMKSDTPEWAWLEKGLADLVTADFIAHHVSVLARDEMESIAEKLHWVPEFVMADPKRVEEVQEHLRIDDLITGVYVVQGNQITLTAELIDVASRREVARKEVTGKTVDMLDLQRQLSAEVLGWLDRRPPAQILPELWPWTRSIPAAKALYEGLNLYDQGRYGEAWVKFRQAGRQDPEYYDAMYWTARMYYFMDRYEHARRAYEQFIYLNTTHPRVGDAIKEYVHTYEKLDVPAATLLTLYQRLIEAHPDALIFNEMDRADGMPNKRWLEVRTGQLLGQIARYREGAEIATRDRSDLGQWAFIVAWEDMMNHHLLTGELAIPDSLAQLYGAEKIIRFRAGATEVVKHTEVYYPYDWWLVAAPTGYVFKTLRMFPLAKGGNVNVGMHVHKDAYGDVPVCQMGMALTNAIAKGFYFPNLPRCGLFHFHLWRNDSPADPSVKISGMRVVAEFEKIGPHGALDVLCDSTHDFRVDVDGRMGRSGNGLVGLLSPGEHTLRFSSGRKAVPPGVVRKTPLQDWETNVTVRAGQTVRVIGHLPWKQDDPWQTWSTGTLIGRDYPGYALHLSYEWGRPSFQLDDDSIRVVWAYMGALWWSISHDGQTFSPPEKFAMPISSGWLQESPQLLHDQSGRYLLTFLSDRAAQHNERLYVSWSRDFVHWSAPALVADRKLWHYDLIQDDQGRYLCADATDATVTILASRDAYRWEPLTTLPLPGSARRIHLIQRRDGGYDLAVAYAGPRPKPSQHVPDNSDYIGLYRSPDAVTWSKLKPLTILESSETMSFSLLCPRDKTILAYFEDQNRWIPLQLLMQAEKADGTWETSARFAGVAGYDASLAWHPRWGYIITWFEPLNTQFPNPCAGPYFIRGPNLKAVFGNTFSE